jgi:hypothetical protein
MGVEISHLAVGAFDGLAHDRCRDLIGNLDVPDFAFALRCEVGEQFWDHRHIADLVAAQTEAARNVSSTGSLGSAKFRSVLSITTREPGQRR